MKNNEGFSGLTSGTKFPIPIATPPEHNIVLVPSIVEAKARQLYRSGEYKQALELLEKHIWARIR